MSKLCGRRIWRAAANRPKQSAILLPLFSAVVRIANGDSTPSNAIDADVDETFAATFDVDRPPTWCCLYFATYVREKSTADPWWLAVCRHDNESHPIDPTTIGGGCSACRRHPRRIVRRVFPARLSLGGLQWAEVVPYSLDKNGFI